MKKQKAIKVAKAIFDTAVRREEVEPIPDIAKCTECGWEGDVGKCGTEQDGDWESGYYNIHTCPECEDGGLIEDYSMSEERAKEWNEWYENKKKRESKDAEKG